MYFITTAVAKLLYQYTESFTCIYFHLFLAKHAFQLSENFD